MQRPRNTEEEVRLLSWFELRSPGDALGLSVQRLSRTELRAVPNSACDEDEDAKLSGYLSSLTAPVDVWSFLFE